MGRITISEVAKRTGLATSAIRYYEREGLIPPAPKEGGRRVYDADVLDRIAVIRLAKDAGMTIAETKQLLGPIGRGRPAAVAWQKMTRDKLGEIDEQIARLEKMKNVLAMLTDCECPSLDACGRALREQGRC